MCQKSTYQVELDKGDTHLDYGVKIEAELAEDNDREDELRIYVAEVRPDSLAHSKGIVFSSEVSGNYAHVISNYFKL